MSDFGEDDVALDDVEAAGDGGVVGGGAAVALVGELEQVGEGGVAERVSARAGERAG